MGILFSHLAISQTLFAYGAHTVSKDEFLRAFNKNLSADSLNREQALKEYLDLYINYKLKVQAARDLKMDTLPSMKGDIQNFRRQIEDSYLKDDKEVEALVMEAYDRSKKDLHVLHFFSAVDPKMAAGDTSKQFHAIEELYEELKKGKRDYDEIVSEVKKEVAPVSGSDLGFITVFTLPFEFENIVYALNPGEVSKPYRSKKGWHVFKLVSERPAVGKVQVAQILFSYPPGNAPLRNMAKKTADSSYEALKNGADFSELAKTKSDDRISYMNGGILPEFGIGKYDGAFEQAAFSLEKDGDISQPFETEFGFHILKRIARKPIANIKTDEEAYSMLRQQVLEDKRISIAKEKYLSEILKKIGYTPSPVVSKKQLQNISDSFLLSGKNPNTKSVNANTVLFSFNNQKVTVGDWLKYLKTNAQPDNLSQVDYTELHKKFLDAAATENYRTRLETFSPEFKQQMNDFKDGNMLFEIMNERVWSKANDDTTGLKNYYAEHKLKYKWEQSASALLFSVANRSIADSVMAELKEGRDWRKILEEYSGQMQGDSGRFELSQIPVLERTNFEEGLITAPVTNPGDGTVSFVKILKMYPEGGQRSFEDAKGIVINDYQGQLEKRWLDQLKNKYPVKVNQEVFKSLL